MKNENLLKLLKISKSFYEIEHNINLLIKNVNLNKFTDFKYDNNQNKWIKKFRREVKQILKTTNINFKILQNIKNKIIKQAQKDVFKNISYYDLLKSFLFAQEIQSCLDEFNDFFKKELGVVFKNESIKYGWVFRYRFKDREIQFFIDYKEPMCAVCFVNDYICFFSYYEVDLSNIEKCIKMFKKELKKEE